jgi:hypothetical protein
MSDELARLIKQLIVKVDILNKEVKKLSNPQSEPYSLIDKHEAALRTGLSAATLKKYRLMTDSPLIKDIHYVQINERSVKYRSPLIEDWAANRNDPDVCLSGIERYMEYEKSKGDRDSKSPAA